MSLTVNYFCPDSHEPPPLNRKWLKVACFCGALPLVAGVGDFLMWLLTRDQNLCFLGIIIIMGGCLFVVAGMLAIVIHIASNWKRFHHRHTRRECWVSVACTVLLLLSNFAVCAAIIAAVMSIDPLPVGD